MKRFLMTVALAALAFAAGQDLPEGEGKKLVSDKCSSCHGLDLVVEKKLGRDGWKEMLDKMAGYGVQLEEKEVPIALDYLTKYFGPPVAAAGEATAKKFIEGVCSTCHGPELITDTQATKQEWLDIVIRMNGKGAGLSDQDVELLSEYLAKTYGKKKIKVNFYDGENFVCTINFKVAGWTGHEH